MVAGMFFCPPAALAGGLVASFGGIGVEAYNEATRKEGMSEEAKKELTEELITNAALFGVGGGAAKMGSAAKAALLAKKCPKLMACISDIGVDSTISLLGDLALTGEINLEGEGLSQIMSILAGHTKKLKFNHKKLKPEKTADLKNQQNLSTGQQLVKSGFNETYAQHLADIIDKKPEIKDKLIKLVKSNRVTSADYKVLVEMATPDNIDNLLKLSKNKSLCIEYDTNGKVVRNDFESVLKAAEANHAYKEDLIDIASKPTRSSDDIQYIIKYIEKYPEYSNDICDLIKNNQNIKVGEDLYGNPRNDIDLIIGYIKENPDYSKEIKEYMLVQRKANNDTSSCVRDLSDYLMLLKNTDSADIKTITSLAKNPNIKIDDLWNIKNNLGSLTTQEINDLLSLSNKKLDIAGINYNLDLIKQYPELRDILTKEAPSYKFLDEDIANTSSDILAKRANIKSGIEKMFPNELKELKTTLGEEYFEKIKWEDIIPANASDTEIKNILYELNDSSKFFARLSTNEAKYGKNIQWAHEMNVISESAEFLIKQGKSFDEVMAHVAAMYKNYDVAKTLDSNQEIDSRRLYSGQGRENIPDNDWAKATGYSAYTSFNKNEGYSEYYERFMKVIDKKRKPPYPDVTLTKIIHDAGGNTIMAHPKNSTVSATMAHAQKRYEELGPLIAKVKSGKQLTPDEKAMAHEKIAEIYFLTANAMPYARGSNGIADIFMRSLYKELGIDMPALKHNVSLDLEAFCMDLDTYKKKWTSFFEQ